MSFHDPESDLSVLNRNAFDLEVRVNPLTHQVLKIAQKIWEKTDGLFDCTVASVLVRFKFLPKTPFNANLHPKASYEDIQLLPGDRVRYKKRLILDLGGIAKGFAVDQAVKELKRHGISNGSVNAGGDIRVFGRRKKTVYLRCPENLGRLIPLSGLTNAAIATSGAYHSLRRFKGRSISHFANPKNRRLFSRDYSVTVFADDCITADALTKPVMILEDPHAAFLKKFRAKALILKRDMCYEK